MFNNFKKQSGFSLVGILIVVVIIAALAYGSLSFWSKKTGKDTKGIGGNLESTIDAYNQAKQDLGDINERINERNELLNETADLSTSSGLAGQQTTDEGDLSTEGWQIYEKEEKNVQLKYHKDWYYDRDEAAEKELGYDLLVGFAESPEILEKGRVYPIEFMIWPSSIGILDTDPCEYEILKEKDNKKYILSMCDYNKYSEIMKKMVESFEFLKK